MSETDFLRSLILLVVSRLKDDITLDETRRMHTILAYLGRKDNELAKNSK
jgi:hypothetical protein